MATTLEDRGVERDQPRIVLETPEERQKKSKARDDLDGIWPAADTEDGLPVDEPKPLNKKRRMADRSEGSKKFYRGMGVIYEMCPNGYRALLRISPMDIHAEPKTKPEH